MSPIHLEVYALIVAAAGCAIAITVPGLFGRATSFAFLGIAGVLACAGGLLALVSHVSTIASSGAQHVVVRLDAVSAFFVALIGAIAVLVGLYAAGGKAPDERRTGRTAAAAACAIFAASVLACIADDVLLFLFAWELLALSFYWAIAYAGIEADAPQAGYLTLVVTHVAGAAMLGALLVLAHAGGGYGFPHALAGGAALNNTARSAIFVTLLVGFGAKFGMFSMQAWVPLGYRAAPSTVTALMAGGALNVGFYGVARFLIPLGGTVPEWWAIVVLTLGALGALLGIALGTSERDARTLAAYSSVENAGIILAAFGLALAGRSVHNNALYGLGVAVAFQQIAAHAFSKCTLFLVCSSLRERCGTTAFEHLGGLARSMPVTTTAALVGSMSLAALPPLAGFASEWLVLEALMQAFRTQNTTLEVALAVCGAIIGLAAGIAVVAFVKLVGIGMLGAARSPGASNASELTSLVKRIALIACTLIVLLLGVLSPQFFGLVAPAIAAYGNANAAHAVAAVPLLVQPGFSGFSSTSPLGLLCLIGGLTFVFWLIVRFIPRPPSRRTAVWTSGEHYQPWTQYTGTGFANPTRVILDALTRTVRTPERDTYESKSRPLFDLPWYRRIAGGFLWIAGRVRRTQSGVIAAYLAYILGFTILLLLMYPSIRNW